MPCSEVMSGRPPGYTECPRSDRTSTYIPYRTVYVHRAPFTMYEGHLESKERFAIKNIY